MTRGNAAKVVFWIVAVAFPLNLLAPFVYACSPACDSDDVVAGLSQLSTQLHNTAAFFVYVATALIFVVVAQAVILFVNGRTR